MIHHNSEFSNRICSLFFFSLCQTCKKNMGFQKELLIRFFETKYGASVSVKSVSALYHEIQNSRCHLRLGHCDVIIGRSLCIWIALKLIMWYL